MIRLVFALFIAWAGVAQANENLRDGLAAVRAQDFATAQAVMDRMSDPVARDIVQWTYLRAGQGNFADTLRFLERRGDWPGLPLLRRRQERNIPQGADAMTIVRYFAPQEPRTAQGTLRFAESLATLGELEATRAAMIKAWLTLPMSDADHDEFLDRFGPVLANHHAGRLNAMAWQGEAAAAERMYDLVPEGEAALARARLALRAERDGVDALIEAVPDALRNTPGLAYERFRWRLSKGRTDGALEILLPASRTAAGLGRPEVWATHRIGLARRLMREGRGQEAYRVAANHHLPDRSDAAQLEWLSGYIALRKLGDAARAVDHFTTFKASVGTPISNGRAGYWLGRAQEAAGNTAAAREAYAYAARFQTSFYGQLAAERAGLPADPRLAGTENFADWRGAPFTQSSVVQAAMILRDINETWLTERFLTHHAESLSRAEIGQLIDMVLSMDEHHIAVMIGKRAAQAGHELHKGYYAVPPALVGKDTTVPTEMILSIARRESEFDPVVVSHAGARGLMQVMPRTAQAMAEREGVPYSSDRLLLDPAYNAVLGASYLEVLEAEFGRSPVLVPAAYNAGPTRARRWRDELGDPTDPRVDIIDWIEHVPFTETRNYIMRVSESLAIYRARLTGQVSPPRLGAELKTR